MRCKWKLCAWQPGNSLKRKEPSFVGTTYLLPFGLLEHSVMATALAFESVGSSRERSKLQESRNLAPWSLWSHHMAHAAYLQTPLTERELIFNLASGTVILVYFIFCHSRLNQTLANTMQYLPSSHRTVFFRNTEKCWSKFSHWNFKCIFVWVQTHGIFTCVWCLHFISSILTRKATGNWKE